MKKLILPFIAACLFWTQQAQATTQYCQSTIAVIPSSRAESAVNMLDIISTSCTTACGTYRRAYIEYADKDIMAAALSATYNGTTVWVAFNDSATSKASAVSSAVTCKVLAIYPPH